MKTLKCTHPDCGLELDNNKFYRAPSNTTRGGRDYFCMACRRKQRKDIREETGAGPKTAFCSGICQGVRPISDFYVRAEYTNNNGVDYQCKQCRKDASFKGKKKNQKAVNKPLVDDDYIYCW